MAEKPDIVLDESSLRMWNAGDSPVVHVEGGDNWNLADGDGDLRIGDENARLAIGVALGGQGMGTSRLRAKGGKNRIKLGAGESDTVTINQTEFIVDGHTTLGGQAYVEELLQVSGDAHLDGDIELDGPTTITGGLPTLDEIDLEVISGTVRLDADSSIDSDGDIACDEFSTQQVRSDLVPTFDPLEGAPSIGSSDARWNTLYADTVDTMSTTTTSDRRLKTDIEEFDEGLDAILDLRPVSFSWRDNGDGTHLGLIGQEVADVLPEVVNVPEDDDGYFGIDYPELVSVLIDALQAQHAETDTLTERVERQQAHIEDQQARIDELEDRVMALEDAT